MLVPKNQKQLAWLRIKEKYFDMSFNASIHRHDFSLVADLRDVLKSIAICYNSAERSIYTDFSFIRYVFESQNVSNELWIPSRLNRADLCTKPNSPLTSAHQHLLSSRTFLFKFLDNDVRPSSQPIKIQHIMKSDVYE